MRVLVIFSGLIGGETELLFTGRGTGVFVGLAQGVGPKFALSAEVTYTWKNYNRDFTYD